MKFDTEADLVNLLKEVIQSKFGRDNVEIFQEVSLGLGIADLVVSNLKLNDRVTDNQSGTEVLNDLEIRIFSLVEDRGPLLFDEVLNITRIDKYRLGEIVSKLVRVGYITESETILYKKGAFNSLYSSSCAVEAKLKNWKRALQQAYRYRWFAEIAYVVLDEYYSEPAIKSINLFKEYNVGLATLNSGGELNKFFHPQKMRPFDLNMQRLFSEQIKQSLLSA